MSPVIASRRLRRENCFLFATVVALGAALWLPSAAAAASTATRLVGTNWILADSPSLGAGLTVNDVSALFSTKKVSGSSGCNSYGAAYKVDGSKMTIGPNIVSTKRACASGPTAVESAYLARLVKVKAYTIKGSTLSLLGRSDKLLLAYKASNSQNAIGGQWSATSYYTGSAVQSVIAGTELTAHFGSKEVTGTGGCNTFGGSYETSGDKISIGPVVSTQRACADAAIDTQEQQYLAALDLARRYRVTGSRLDLLRAGGTIAVTFEVEASK